MDPHTKSSNEQRLSPYARQTIEWLAVSLFAGIVLCILGLAAAVVYWAWTA